MLHPCATDETNDDGVTKINERTQLIDNLGWENSRCKSTSKDGIEFGIETTDAHRFEIKIRIDNGHELSFPINTFIVPTAPVVVVVIYPLDLPARLIEVPSARSNTTIVLGSDTPKGIL